MGGTKARTLASITMVVGILLTYLVFQMRYNWYTTPLQANLLNFGFVVFVAVCCLAWFARPSKIFVLVTYGILFFFPPIYDKEQFARLDARFFVLLVIVAIPLIASLEIRRRTWRRKNR